MTEAEEDLPARDEKPAPVVAVVVAVVAEAAG